MEVVWLSLDGFDVTFGKRERHPQSICLPSACPLSKQVCRATVFTIDSDSGSLRLARSAAEDSARCKALLIPGMGENSLSGSECYSREWAKTLNQGWAFPTVLLGLSRKHRAACVFPCSPLPLPAKPLLLLFPLPQMLSLPFYLDDSRV